MRQSFKDIAKEDWEKQKLYYEALIETDSYPRLVDKAFTEWAKEVKLDPTQCELTQERERFFRMSYQATMLAHDLKIPYLFDPDKELPDVAGSMTAVRTVRRQAVKFVVKEIPLDPGPKLRPFGSKISPPLKKEFVPLEPFKKNGRHLLIDIDLHAPKERILAEIEFLIKIHKVTIKTETPKRGITISRNQCSPFKVYKMVKSGKSRLQVTWEIFPQTSGNDPNYDDETKRVYEKVRRAYSKAENLIKEAEHSIPKSLKSRLRIQGNAGKDKSLT